jgi:hypothetical protein
VTRWSGHDPAAGELPGAVFGWTLYVDGQELELFVTHLGERLAKVGARVCRGKPIGKVGAWPHDPPRSHAHIGATAKTTASSKAAALAIGRALRVRPL